MVGPPSPENIFAAVDFCLWSSDWEVPIVRGLHESRDVLPVFLAEASVLVQLDHAHADAHEVHIPHASI